MSDSFADLWSSSAPSKPQNLPLSQQQKKPAAPGIIQQKPGQDLFALLSSTSSTPSYVGSSRMQSSSSLNAANTGSRPITPSMSGSTPGTRPASSLAQSKAGNDAFGDLFSGSSTGGNTVNMTMAERAALAQKERLAAQAPANHTATSHSQWAGLDSLGGGSSIIATSKSVSSLDNDEWGLGALSSSQKLMGTKASTPAKAKHSVADDDDWGLGDFGNQTSNVSQAPGPSNAGKITEKKASTLWDLEDVVSTPSKSQEHVDSPDFDFDFGNREYRETPPPQNGLHHDEDDVLGLLSKPVDAVRSSQQQTRESRPSPAPRPSSSSSRSTSPPPHILGQIIEMGFSIPQAKAALARTETGVDVQAALDLLLAEANDPEEPRQASRPRSRVQRNFSDEEPSRQQPSPPQRDDNSGTPNAEKLIAQASEIGLSVLSKASLFWNQGKEKVQKAYEEANKNVASTGRDSRPKWMQEASGSRDPGDDRERPVRPTASSFRDNDDHEESSAFSDPPRPAAAAPPPRIEQQGPRRTADLLFSSEEPKAYVSPFRRKKAEPSASPAQVASPAPTPPRQAPAAPKPKPKRRLPFCSPSALSRVQQHKTKGTDAFKLGQFSVAADEYTKAIALLPANHLLLIPLQTNRAIAYIRCGECKSAIDDAGGALSIIGSIQGQRSWQRWHPNDEDGGWELESGNAEADGRGGYTFQRPKGSEWTDSWGRGVDLKDGWVKAVKRRAEAFEGLEKWKDARQDWEVLAGGGGGGWVASTTRQEAVRGLGRCKKILDGGDSSAPKPIQTQKPKPRPRPIPASSAVATPGVAVEAYRAQVNAQEAEDALKHSLKDNVEEKLLAWKKGKESNLRALLASLDTILWEEVLNEMGKKPGMADLVSAGGVKKWYMKAVSRVHPDKLNTNNSTVEQRMIAGGVFGALNEAWLAFKP